MKVKPIEDKPIIDTLACELFDTENTTYSNTTINEIVG